MTTPPPGPPPGRAPDLRGESARPAPLTEQAAAALDVSADVLAVLEQVVERLTAVEKATTEEQLSLSRPEHRSDYRFEAYPAVETDKEQAGQVARVRAAWERLDAWVSWLIGTYRLTNAIPACWADHTALREELIGLRVAWAGAWTPHAATDAIAIWHERLWQARTRLLDGNWGNPRCDGTHDDSGLDLADSYRAWVADPLHDHALIIARDRALGTVRANWHAAGEPS